MVWSAPPAAASFDLSQPPAVVQGILDRAVEQGVAQVSWALRPLARPRLASVATACPRYHVRVQGVVFSVQCEGKKTFEWTVGKTGPWTDGHGTTHQVSLTRTGDILRLTFQGDEGGKSWAYDFSTEGALRVTQTVSSAHLAQPMSWVLDYVASK
jgi:hypothetical protein